MSIRNFGRLTPSQGLILGLIGYSVSRQGVEIPTDIFERMENIIQAREHLVALTGDDFEYDLQNWHTFLAESGEYEYTHPYAYRSVAQAVAATFKDNQLLAIVNRLSTSPTSPLEHKRLRNRALRLIEKYNKPNPPGMRPSVRSNEGLREIWWWAEQWKFTDILAGLALPICSKVNYLGGTDVLHARLLHHADQARSDNRKQEYVKFLTAAAKLETQKDKVFNLYQEALAAYSELGEWGWEAYCLSQLAGMHLYWRQFNEWQQMNMRAYQIWSDHEHQLGIGDALIQLASALERAEKYSEACQLFYCAKKLLRNHITYITARDSLRTVSGRRKIPPEVYETHKTPDELVAEFFDDHYIKGHRPLPEIFADDDHQQIDTPDGCKPLPYEILPSRGFVLDLGYYELPTPPGVDGTPANLIRLVRGQNLIYIAHYLPRIQRYDLTSATLRPTLGAPEFTPLQSGETLILTIGRFLQPEQPGTKPLFVPYWVACVNILNPKMG